MENDQDLQCPHCLKFIHVVFETLRYGEEGTRFSELETHVSDQDAEWRFCFAICPACSRLILRLPHLSSEGEWGVLTVYPRDSNRPHLSEHVPGPYRRDYEEAAAVLSASSNASAALSRRCLQSLLRDKAGIGGSTLYAEIQSAIDSGELPAHIVQSLHTLRSFGNVAAHPTKNPNTGEIVPIDPHEAEWCLDVLDFLFSFYFVVPAEAEARRRAFEEKLDGEPTS